MQSAEDAIMEFLKANPQITNSKGRELTGIGSDNTMKNDFIRLAIKNLIERVPNTQGRNSSWQLKPHPIRKPIPKPELDTKTNQYKLPIND